MTHHFLYWLGTGWWCLGPARALLLCMSKTCLLLMRLPWSGGTFAHSAAHPWLLMAWPIFWFPILYGLLPLTAGLCLIVGSSSFNLLSYSFRSLATISCRITLPFLLWCYLTPAYWAYCLFFFQWLNMVIWALYYISCGPFCPIYFLLGILGPFSNSAFPWVFTNSFGLPWLNYLILHPWGSWACHQPFTFFACITSGLL